jgi:hypothetical protein
VNLGPSAMPAPMSAQPTAHGAAGEQLTVRIYRGRAGLAQAVGFDHLAAELALPLTARRAYLARWAAFDPRWTPWVVAVVDPAGRWRAAALLARRGAAGVTAVVGLGQPVNDHARLPALDRPAATALADAVAGELRAIRGPWQLRLEQLPAGDPVARRLAAWLGPAALVPGVGLPRIDLSAGDAPNTYLRRKFRQQTRTARRRFEAVGVAPRVRYLRTPAEVEPLLPALLSVRRARDRDAFYRRELDQPHRARWWQATLLELAQHGHLELAVLDVGASLPAAFNAALLDDRSYRCWDGRINPAWRRQTPGKLLYGELLARVIVDPRWIEVDYLRGETAFKRLTATDVVPTSQLLAWSSATTRAVVTAPGTAYAAARRFADQHPELRQSWRAVKARLRGR